MEVSLLHISHTGRYLAANKKLRRKEMSAQVPNKPRERGDLQLFQVIGAVLLIALGGVFLALQAGVLRQGRRWRMVWPLPASGRSQNQPLKAICIFDTTRRKEAKARGF
jgi:hypothetical protein